MAWTLSTCQGLHCDRLVGHRRRRHRLAAPPVDVGPKVIATTIRYRVNRLRCRELTVHSPCRWWRLSMRTPDDPEYVHPDQGRGITGETGIATRTAICWPRPRSAAS